MQRISRNAQMFQMLAFYIQQCFMMAQSTGNQMIAQQAAVDMQKVGLVSAMQAGGGGAKTISGGETEESSVTRNARERTANATKPKEG